MLQISTDIKSIERELSLLSAAKTVNNERNPKTLGDVCTLSSDQYDPHYHTGADSSKNFTEVRKNLLSSYFADADPSIPTVLQFGLKPASDSADSPALSTRQAQSSSSCIASKSSEPKDNNAENAATSFPESPEKIFELVDDTILAHPSEGCGDDVDLARYYFLVKTRTALL